MASTEEANRLAELYKSYTDEQLSTLLANRVAGSIDAILANRELERRKRLEQHQLDMKLIAEQARWMKFSAVLGAAATLVGAVIGVVGGVLLTMWLKP